MRARAWIGIVVFATTPFIAGCSTMSNTGKGALAGGALGAGTGAIISKATGGNAGPGAVVGGLIGAVAGGAIGNEHDRREKEALFDRARQAEDRAAAASTQLGMADVMQLAKDGHADDVIINQIRTTNSTYQLSTEDLRMLRANQVSDRVIVEMQSRRADAPRHPRYVAVPGGPPVIYAPARPIYVVSPPPPGFHVGVHVHD